MNWDEKFSVNIGEIDSQHKKLFALINELFDGMRAGRGKDILGAVLSDLIAYTVYHFNTEERIFQQYGYPERIKHKQEHDELTRKAKELKADFEGGNRMISIEVMNFLRDWLNVHILQEDKKYVPFLTSKGVK